MKKLKTNYLILLLAMSSVNISAQDQKQEKPMTPDEKAWMAYMAPGKMHEMMAKSAGIWNEEVTMWMAPDAPPVKSTSTTMNRMIMGNRYLQGMHRGSFNGMSFEGISTVGYDNAKKVFVSSWIDNMGTGMMYAEGTWNEAGKSIAFKGKQVDPMSGKELDVRQVLKFVNDSNQVMEMYMTPLTGHEYKSMEIKYTRKVGMPAQPHDQRRMMPSPIQPQTPVPGSPKEEIKKY